MENVATATDLEPPDSITVLECVDGHRATKRICLGPGERGVVIDGYDAGSWFTARVQPLAGPDGLFALLQAATGNPKAFIIRGVPSGAWDVAQPHRRTSQPKPTQPASYTDAPHRWLAIDMDRVPQPAGTDPATDPLDAIEHLVGLLPDEFQGVRCWWQWTSGQGFKGDTLNARLWFWLSEPASDVQLRAWARGVEHVDAALFSAVEPHYVAAPILGTGVRDPLPVRSGIFCHGGADAVCLDLPPAPPRATERRDPLGGDGECDSAELAALLAAIPNNDLPYDQWLSVGTRVKAASGDAGEDAFVGWSARSRKHDEETARRKFRSLQGAGGEHGLYLIAREHGYDPLRDRGVVIDLALFRSNIEARNRATAPAEEDWRMPDPIRKEVEEAEAAPNALPEPIGLVRVIRDLIVETSKYPQPELALAAALAIVGTAGARRYSFDGNVRPNTYFLGVAPSASGKNAPLEAVERILSDAGFSDALAGGEPSSGSAVTSRLLATGAGRHGGVAVYVIDEFGMLLRAMTGERAPQHVREIVKALTVVYTKSAGRYAGKDFADRQDRPTRTIQQPHLSVFGVTAGTHVWKGITPDSIADGSIARFMVIEAANPFPAYNRGARPPVTPQMVKDALQRIYDCGGRPNAGNLAGATLESPPSLREMAATPAAARLFDEAVDREIELKRQHHAAGLSAVFGRWVEQSKKLAMIHSLGRDPESATIDEVDARFGLDLALTLIERFVTAIGRNVVRNEWEEHSKTVLAMIKAGGRKGVAQNEITRRTQYLKRRDRDELLGSLEEAGVIRCERARTVGMARTVWKFVKPS